MVQIHYVVCESIIILCTVKKIYKKMYKNLLRKCITKTFIKKCLKNVGKCPSEAFFFNLFVICLIFLSAPLFTI